MSRWILKPDMLNHSWTLVREVLGIEENKEVARGGIVIDEDKGNEVKQL